VHQLRVYVKDNAITHLPPEVTGVSRFSFFELSKPIPTKLVSTSIAPIITWTWTGRRRMKSPTTATGIVKLRPMVTTRGVVFNMAKTYRKSLDHVIAI